MVSKNWSLTGRLMARILLWVTVVWAGVLVGVYVHTREHVYELLDSHLRQTVDLLALQPLDELKDTDFRKLQERRHGKESEHSDDDATIFQVWKDQQLLVRSVKAPEQALTAQKTGFDDLRWNGESWRIYATVGEDDVVVMVGENVAWRKDIVWGNVQRVLTGLIVAYPLMALLVWFTVRGTVRPLREASSAVAQRHPQSTEPLTVDNPPKELQPLLAALNQLFGKVDTLLQTERRFTADAAHELRTPVAATRMMAQVAQGAATEVQRNEALEGVLRGCDRSTHLVEQLLQLARLEEQAQDGAQLPLENILPALEQVRDELLQTQAEPRQQTLHWQAPDVLYAHMTPTLASVLLRNLLDNALRYSPEGAQVRVQLQHSEQEGMHWTVEDSGPGMEPADMQRLGERFFRVLGTGRTGSGLGWSIVQRIAALYQLQVQVDRSSDLGGLRIQVAQRMEKHGQR